MSRKSAIKLLENDEKKKNSEKFAKIFFKTFFYFLNFFT